MALTMAVTEFLTDAGDGDFEGFLAARMKAALDLAVEEQQSAKQTGEELAAESMSCRLCPRCLRRNWDVRPR